MLKSIYFFLFIFYFSVLFSQSENKNFQFNYYSIFGFRDTVSEFYSSLPDSSLTSLNYLSAGKKFQIFTLKHFNLNKHLPFQFVYKRFYSNGYFRNSSFRNGRFDVKADNKWHFFFLKYSGKYLNSYRNEFGGIQNDSLLLAPAYEPLQVPVNLTNARNFYKFRLTNADFGFTFNDTSSILIGSTVYWLRTKRFYSDENSNGFYANNYFNDITSADSLFFDSLATALYVGYKFKQSVFRLSFGNIYNHYIADSIYYQNNGQFVASDIKFKFSQTIQLNFYVSYVLTGYFSNAQYCEISLLKSLKKSFFRVAYSYNNSIPSFLSTFLASNHFIYNYDFSNILQNSIDFTFSMNKKLSVAYKFSNILHGIYFDYYSLPKQYLGNAFIHKLNVAYNDSLKRFVYGAKINIANTSDKYIYPVSPFSGNTFLFYTHKLFKGKLFSKFGFRVSYFTPYYAPMYMPALHRFYAQNDIEIGGYPLVDFEWHFTLKRFNLMLRVNNLLDRFDGDVWYVMPQYPLWKRNFQIGMKWDLYN